jgi:hypothetical protein
MTTLKIESGAEGNVWVTLTRFSDADIARLKRIPGHRWNPERKRSQAFASDGENTNMASNGERLRLVIP